MKKIVLVGGGGHCKSIIDTLLESNDFIIEGIVDPNIQGEDVFGIKVIGNDDILINLYESGCKYAFISVGSIGECNLREKLSNKLKSIGFILPSIVDCTAIVSKNAVIEGGVFVGKGAIINANTLIKENSIINTRSIVEHDCIIEKFVHVAPGAVISGGVKIGYGSHIGANATVIQNINIGEKVMIGAGSVIIRDVNNNKRYCGNPGREI